MNKWELGKDFVKSFTSKNPCQIKEMTKGDRGKLFILFVPLFTLSLLIASCRNVLSLSFQIEKQIKALDLPLTGRDVLTILPTGYWKSYIYEVFSLAKLSALNPNACFPLPGVRAAIFSRRFLSRHARRLNERGTARSLMHGCYYLWMIKISL